MMFGFAYMLVSTILLFSLCQSSDVATRQFTVVPVPSAASLSRVSYLMSRERLKIPASNLNPFIDPAFSLSYTNELERLEKNYSKGNSGPHRVAMATDNETNELIGYIDLDKRFRTDVSEVRRLPPPWISDLVVDPAWRRKGVAKEMLQYMEAVCFNPKEWNYKKLYLLSDMNNVAGTSLYLKNGFRPVQFEIGESANIKKTASMKTVLSSAGAGDIRDDDLPALLGFFASQYAQEWDRVLFVKTVQQYLQG
jgi:GNAT superfamily N-acetyltransferase